MPSNFFELEAVKTNEKSFGEGIRQYAKNVGSQGKIDCDISGKSFERNRKPRFSRC